jgi:hypothetical protein
MRFRSRSALSLLFVVLVVRAALHALPSARARIGAAAA